MIQFKELTQSQFFLRDVDTKIVIARLIVTSLIDPIFIVLIILFWDLWATILFGSLIIGGKIYVITYLVNHNFSRLTIEPDRLIFKNSIKQRTLKKKKHQYFVYLNQVFYFKKKKRLNPFIFSSIPFHSMIYEDLKKISDRMSMHLYRIDDKYVMTEMEENELKPILKKNTESSWATFNGAISEYR